MPSVALEVKNRNFKEKNFKSFLSLFYPWGTHGIHKKNVSPFGQVVWPATIANKIYIYISEELYYIDILLAIYV